MMHGQKNIKLLHLQVTDSSGFHYSNLIYSAYVYWDNKGSTALHLWTILLRDRQS